MDKSKEINTNGWIHLKIYEYIYFDISLNGIQNFIEKYQHMSTLQAMTLAMYNDVPHLKISNDVITLVFLKVRTL